MGTTNCVILYRNIGSWCPERDYSQQNEWTSVSRASQRTLRKLTQRNALTRVCMLWALKGFKFKQWLLANTWTQQCDSRLKTETLQAPFWYFCQRSFVMFTSWKNTLTHLDVEGYPSAASCCTQFRRRVAGFDLFQNLRQPTGRKLLQGLTSTPHTHTHIHTHQNIRRQSKSFWVSLL